MPSPLFMDSRIARIHEARVAERWLAREREALAWLCESEVFAEIFEPFSGSPAAVPLIPSTLFPYSHHAATPAPEYVHPFAPPPPPPPPQAFEVCQLPRNCFATDEEVVTALQVFCLPGEEKKRSSTAQPASFYHLAKDLSWEGFTDARGRLPRLLIPGVSLGHPDRPFFPVIDGIPEQGWGHANDAGLILRVASLRELRMTGAQALFIAPVPPQPKS